MKKRAFTIVCISVILAAAGILFSASPLQVPTGTWIAVGAMNSARIGAATVLLQDGRILITGGSDANGPSSAAEFFGANGSFSPATQMNVPRSGHVSVILQDGRVLVAGGTTSGGAATNSAEIYDPVTSAWTNVTGGMVEARTGATATVLQDGRVLVAGGQNGSAISSTIEIFDPALGVFMPAGMMSSPRTQHAMTMLLDGRVLIVGGNNGTAPVASTDIFDPNAGAVSAGPAMSFARFGHSATTLLNGQVVIIGGNNGNANPAQMDVTPAELIDFTAATPAFSTLTSNLGTPREGHLAFLLANNNNVLIAGGTSGGVNVASAELFTPQESTQGVWAYVFGPTGSMATARSAATGAPNQVSSTSTVMRINGALLVAGGKDSIGNALNSAEAYGFPTVQTDASDYPPGTNVTITGNGFQANENVTIQLVESPLIDMHGPYTVQADVNGNFVDTSFTTDQHDENVRFFLMATGQTSGFQAQNTFTDSSHFSSLSVGGQTGTATYGTAASPTYTITAGYGGSGIDLNDPVTLTFVGWTSTVPTGVSTSISPGSVTAGLPTSSLKITTSATTQAGSYGFTVKGTNAANPSFTGTGTLVVSTRAISVTAATNTKTYDGTTSAAATPTITSGSLATGDTSNFTEAYSNKNVGTGNKTLVPSGSVTDGHGGVNYTVTFVNNTTGTISARALTVTAATNSKAYDGTTTAGATPTISSGTVQTGDTANFIETYSSKNVGTGLTLTPSGTVTDGNGGANYTYTFVSNTTGVITVRAITVTAAANSKTYDGTTSAGATPTITSGSLASGDTSSFTETYDTKNVGTGKTLTPAGSVSDGNSGNNYAVTFANNTTGAITARALTVTAATNTKTYDGTTFATATPTVTVGAVQTGDTANFTESYSNKNAGVGNKTLIPTGSVTDGNSGNNYTYTFVNFTTGTINKLALTVTAATNTKTYDGTASAAGVPTITSGAVQTGDTANFTEAYSNKNVGSGKTLTPTGTVTDGNSGANYTYTFVTNTTGVISAEALTITAATNSKGYDGTTTAAAAPTITSGVVQTGDTANFTETYSSKNVGTGLTLTPSGTVTDGNAGANYTYTFVTDTTGVISARGITVTAATNSKTYDGTTAAAATPTITSGSLASGDSASFTETYGSKNVGTGLTLTPSGTVSDGNSGNNYAVTFVNNTTGVITARAITVTAATNTKNYDSTTVAAATPAITSGTLATGDTANFTEAYSSKNVGTGLTLTPSGTVSDGNSGSNYAVTFVHNTTGVITARAITVTAATNSKPYDGTTAASATPTITSGSLAGSETASFTEVYSSKNVGTGLTLTPSGTVSDGNGGNNYAVTFVNNTTGVITARAITVTAATNTKNYDSTKVAAATPAITSGTLAAGDTANFTEAYSSKNVGTGLTLTPSGTVTDGNSGSNYAVTFVTNTTGVITARALTVTAATNTRIYDGTTNAAATPGITSGTLQGTDTANFTEAYSSRSVGTSLTLIPSGTVTDGNSGDNYSYNFVNNTTGVITAKALTYSGLSAPASKPYDDTTAATVSGTATLLTAEATGTGSTADDKPYSVDSVSLSGTPTAAYNSKDVSAATTVTFGGLSLTGNGNGNYTLTASTQAATITPATLVYTATAASRPYNSANPTFTGTVTGFAGTDNQGSATTGTLTFTSTATTGSDAGSYPINGSGLTANLGDYTFAQAASNATALTVTKLTPTFTTPLTSPAPITYGTATVSLPPNSPMIVAGGMRAGGTDTVIITINGVSSAPIPFNGNSGTFGPINFDTHALAVSGSPYTITYTYSGNTNFNSLTDTSTTLTVNQATPTATLAVNNSPVTYNGSGQAATVTVSTSSVPGTVADILTGGAATQTTAGTYAVTASFVPTDSTDYKTLTGLPAGSFVISQATPTATLAVNNSPVIYNGSGQAATVTVSTSSVPGTVANILTGGAATQTTAGTYAVTASFVPTDSTDYKTLTGLPAGSFVISQATPTATLAVTNSPVIYNGSGQAATVTISTSSVPGTVANILTGGAATQTTVGTYAVTASFVPTDSTDYKTLTGLAAGSFIINQATPTATLAVNNSPVIYNGSGQAATVTISSSSVPGTVANILTGGAATQTTAGTYAVTASFVPTDSTDYKTLTGLPAGSFVISQATPTATLAVTNSPVIYNGSGQAATVTISSSSVPGTVANILTGGAATQTTVGTYAVTASFVPTDSTDYKTLTGLPAGSFVINQATSSVTVICPTSPETYTGSAQSPCTASYLTSDGLNGVLAVVYTNNTDAGTAGASAAYLGDSNHGGSSGSSSFTISPASSSTALSSSGNPSNYGDTVTFTATVSSGAGTPSSGTVQFLIDGANYASPSTVSSGTASVSTSSLSPGQHTITAVYSGATDFTGSNSAFFTQTVANALTSISVTPATPTIFVGQTQQFTANGTFADGTSAILPGGGLWAVSNSLTNAVRAPMAAGNNGTIYFFGGQDSHPENYVQIYNPASGVWTAGANMPTARFQGTAVAPGDGNIYVIGGWNVSLPTSVVEAYNPSTNTWASKASMGHLSACSVSGAINGKIYVLTGCNGTSGYFGLLDVYDPVANTWTSLPSAPNAHGAGAGGVINGKLYVVGGYNSSGSAPTGTLDVYDPQSNTWSSKASMPGSLGELSGGFANGQLYVVGGLDSSNAAQSSVYVYDPASDSWGVGPSLSQNRRDIGVATLDGLLYAGGGYNTSGTNLIEILDTDTVTWTSDMTSVATVDPNAGLATGLTPGTSHISAASTLYPAAIVTSALLTVQNAHTMTTVTSSENPSTYGDSVNFTATVAPQQNGLPTPTGTVQFVIDGTNFGSPVTLTGATANSGSTSTLIVANSPHSIEAQYIPANGSVYLGSAGSVMQAVNPAILTASITGDPAKTYDGTTTATLTPANYKITGLIGSDSFTVTQTVGVYNSANVAAATTVTASLPSGNFTPVGATVASNYTLPTTASGPGQITPVTLTASIIGNPSKTYNGNTNATLASANFSLATLVAGESISVTQTSGTYNSANVTSATTITASLTGSNFTPGTGTLLSNYTLPTTASGPGQITPVTLTASIIGNPSKTYNGNTNATLASANFSLATLVAGESISVTQTSGTYNSANVTSATTITASLTGSNFTPGTGTLLSNYTLPTTTSGPGQITPVTLTASIIGGPTKPYDGTTNATLTSANFSLTPLVGSESFTVTKTSGTYNYKDVTTATTVTASLASGDFSPTNGAIATNYVLPSTASGAGTITAVTLTASIIGDPTKIYDGNASATLTPANFSLTPLVGSESFSVTQTSGTYNTQNVVGADTVTAILASGNFTPVGATLAGNYNLPTTASGAGQITARPATWTTNPSSKTYGDSDPTPLTTGSGTNFVAADDVTATYSRAAGETVLGGPYHITATLAPTGVLSNYIITNTGASFTITARAATWTTNPNSKTYGDSDPTPLTTGSGTNFVAADDVTATYSRAAGETVLGGPYHITATLAPTAVLSNYIITNTGASFTITARAATWTTSPSSKTYGDSDPTPLTTGSGTNFIGADSVTATYSRVAGETVLGGPYHITATLAPTGVLSNYIITNTGASFTITARAATWTTNPNSKTYGDNDPTPLTSGSGTNFIEADNVTATYSRAAGETVLGGPYHITATLAPTGVLSNYIITNTGASFTITARAATWTTNPNSKTYGDNDPTPLTSGSGTNFIEADNVTATYSRAAGETVLGGPYHITATLSPSGVLSNYIITNTGASFTVTARAATWTTNPNSKTYGSADPSPLTTGSGTFLAADGVTATYSRAAGETVLGGPYHITATLGPAAVLSNYTITNAGANFTISPAPLTIIAASSPMTYGGPAPIITASYSGLANGDTSVTFSTAPNAPPVCGTAATSSSPVIASPYYPSFCSGAADSNYAISYMNGTVNVLQAATSIAVTSSVNPATYMQLVTFTATVTPQYSGTTPTGTVTFYNNGSQIGTGTLSVALCGTPPCQDQATFNTSSLPDSGPDMITVVYSGDTNFVMSDDNASALTQTVQPSPNVSLSPMFVAFGNLNVGLKSSPATVTLSNIGDAPLNISSPNGITIIQPGTDFAETNNCGSTLLATKSCTITITFAPVDTGVRTANLQITDNDDDATNAQQIVSLTGSGLTTIAGNSLFTDAIFATANGCGSITDSGNGSVDSFNSSAPGGYNSSHVTSGGNVGTNGNVSLSGNSTIYGTAAVDSVTTGTCNKTSLPGVSTNGGAKVTGGPVALNGPITYPTPPAPNPAPPTTNQNISGSCPSGMVGCTNVGPKNVSLAPGGYGNVSASGGTTVHVSKGTYNINSLTLSGQSILSVDSGPVMINLAGVSLSGGSAALDATGGSIQNPSGIPSMLQFAYAGSRGINLSGGAESYATVYAPNALVNMSGNSDFFGSIIASTLTNSGNAAIHYDTSLPNIQGGNYIWFSAVVNNLNGLPVGVNAAQVKLYLTNSTISYTANGTPYNVQVPNAVVTFNSTTPLGTTFTTSNRWSTSVPKSSLTGNTFVTGVAVPVPAGGFQGGIQNVKWSASFSTDTPGVTLQWQWGAAVYTSLNTCYAYQNTSSGNACYNAISNSNVLGVNPEDGSADANGSDPAGTPESFKTSVIFGASGGGLTNYTGYLSSGAGVVPTVAPMSISPSSLDFGPQNQFTTSAQMTAVLSNNDSMTHNFSGSGITITGTNASDFSLVPNGPGTLNNCIGMSSLTGGFNCTLYVTFTPSDVSTRTAKIVINDDANNTPQSVALAGTGQ